MTAPELPPWLATLARLGERSPIAVRQLRQQLRGRAWSAAIIVIPALCLLAAMLSFAAGSQDRQWTGDVTTAKILFAGYLLGWGLLCGAIQPGSIGQTMRGERIDQAWDLIELAGLGGYAIAVGFWCAALVQIVLMSSLFAPFLVMAWLLRGVDTGALLLALVLVPAWGALMAALAVSTASGPIPKKKGVNRIQLGISFLSFVFGARIYVMLLETNGAARVLWLFGGGFTAVGIAISIWLVLVAGCLVHAGSALSHPARNRSTGPRLVAIVAALFALLWSSVLASPARESLAAAAILILSIATWTGLAAIAEFDGTTRHQQRWIDQARGFWKYTAWFLAPGCRRGRRCVLLLAALGLGCALLSGQPLVVRLALCIIAYSFACLVIGDAVARGLNTPIRHKPRVQAMITGTMVVVLPFAFAGVYALFSPIMAITTPLFAGAVAAVFTAILVIQSIKTEHTIIRLVGETPPER